MLFRFAEEGLAARMPKAGPPESGEQEQFRARFQRAFCRCLQKGFLPEDCFGLIWNEALEAASLTEADQRQLQEELREWAKAEGTCPPRARNDAKTPGRTSRAVAAPRSG